MICNSAPQQSINNVKKYFLIIAEILLAIAVHKNKLFSVVNVAVNKSKTSCHQVIISF